MTYVTDTIDWDAMKAAGVQYVIVRASYGVVEDTTYLQWIPQIQTAGLVFGSYHFLTRRADPVLQAQRFLDTRLPGTIGPTLGDGAPSDWLDVERNGNDVPTWEQVRAFIAEHARVTGGAALGIYTNYDTWVNYIKYFDPEFAARHPLWVASWRNDRPLVPRPWQTALLWQYGATRLPGYARDIDVNRVM